MGNSGQWFSRTGKLVGAGATVAIGYLVLSHFIPMEVLKINKLTAAENTCRNLKNAISAYFTEFRKYPLEQSAELDIDTTSAKELMEYLCFDSEPNSKYHSPRRVVFYADRKAKAGSEGHFRGGLSIDQDGKYELWDTWGNHYRVRLDSNRDNHVTDPEQSGQILPESILVWSAGPDGNFETWGDNIKTW